jgi:glycosyltransferase involved in cell wall biosynthesis
MKIAVDITLMAEETTGIGKYLYYLIKSISHLDEENKYLLFSFFFRNFRQRKRKLSLPASQNFSSQIYPFPMRVFSILTNFFSLPLEFFIGKFQILHLPGFTCFPVHQAKIIATVHDLAPLFFPAAYTAQQKKELAKFLLVLKKRVDKIIAVSNQTKKDLINELKIPEEKIKVIYHGRGEEFRVISQKKSLLKILKKYKLREKFILSVGTLHPRKNFLTLINAYSLLLKKNPLFPYQLVIVGKKGWFYQKVLEKGKSLTSPVLFLGYLPQEDLVALYNLASLFVYPSLYEGFGLPVLEAMACGCPVIASNDSSLKEIAEGAACLVNPRNTEVLANSIHSLLLNKEKRELLKKRGLERAQKFSWEKTAWETISLYREVAERKNESEK